LGGACIALAAVAHVGTATIGIPISLGVAALAMGRQWRAGWRAIVAASWPFLVALAALGVYGLLVLLPASRDYVTNPASLAYRGADRLFSGLFAYWPTSVVTIVGGAAVLVGAAGELVRRAPGYRTSLLLWAVLAWGSLLYAVVTGIATDYPRFATVILAPLVIAAALPLAWLAESLGTHLRGLVSVERPPSWPLVAMGLFILVITPFAVLRYQGQVAV